MNYIGVDIGGMTVKAGIITEKGEIIAKKVINTRPDEPSQIIVQEIADLIKAIAEENGLTFSDIEGIGVGVPGSVDSKRGIVRYCANINLKNVKLMADLSALLKFRKIKVSNDANCAALGETKFGAGRGADFTVMVTLGTGVGSGVIADGKLLEGGFSAGMEAGHMTVTKTKDVCGCGHKGHWEVIASATALIRQTERAIEKNPDSYLAKLAKKEGKVTGKTAFDAAKQGDKTGHAVVKKYLENVGVGLVNLINIFYPEILIIGGGISNEGDTIIKPLQRYCNKNAYGRGYNPKFKLVTAELKNDAGIVGAACLTM